MSLEERGADEAARAVEAMAERMRNLGPVLRVVASDTATLIDDSFRQLRGPDGTMWDALAPSTVARRRRGEDGARSNVPLNDSGTLRRSVYSTSDDQAIRFGTNVPYARYHQEGTGRIPQRAFLPAETTGVPRLIESGPAGTHWRRASASIAHYIATGQVR